MALTMPRRSNCTRAAEARNGWANASGVGIRPSATSRHAVSRPTEANGASTPEIAIPTTGSRAGAMSIIR